MIPVRLRLKNFLPYRGDMPSFSFEGVHLACISGDNGAGKTSIVDAMTWALWGKSRLRSKSTTDDDLITLGEQDTAVTFDFQSGDGQIYRVERRRIKAKKPGSNGQSELCLYIYSSEGFKSISGSTMSETGDKISKLLQLDYDTFINSAYLKQGEADHFTELRPTERKEVLSNILGLYIYEELADNAKVRANEAATTRKLLSENIGLEQHRLLQRPELETSLTDTQQELTVTDATLKEKRAVLDSFHRGRQLIKSQGQALNQAESICREIENDLKARQADLAESEKRVSTYQSVISNRERVEEGFAKYQTSRNLNDALNQKLVVLRQKEKQTESFHKAITEILHSLERKRDSWQAAFDELSGKAEALEKLNQSLASMKLEMKKLVARERQFEEDNNSLQKLNLHIAKLDAEMLGHKSRFEEIVEKSKLLASTSAVSCPVCETELSETRLQTVRSKYETERAEAQIRLSDLVAVKTEKLNAIIALERNLTVESWLKAERARLTSLEARVLRDIEEAESAAQRLPEGIKQLADISNKIQKDDYALDERKNLSDIETEIKQLNYDALTHERVALDVKTLAVFDQQQRELLEAQKLLNADEIARQKNESSIRELDQRLLTRQKEIVSLKEALSRLPRIDTDEILYAESEVKELTTAVNAASEKIGSLKQSLSQLNELEKDIAGKTVEMNQYAASESIFKELHRAFGKNGIQALLIENAVPEMEAEANRLLAKMTDNRMSLKLELQRTTRKGEVVETFDIKVSDELGTRDYDLFSGGEAFRINFALRLALSRVLAHRTGAPLRTLIIDEGFGTQDASGIDKLKEAISSIQDQFDCILVITHIEEFKDAFPARIEVFKTADGSNIQVSYN